MSFEIHTSFNISYFQCLLLAFQYSSTLSLVNGKYGFNNVDNGVEFYCEAKNIVVYEIGCHFAYTLLFGYSDELLHGMEFGASIHVYCDRFEVTKEVTHDFKECRRINLYSGNKLVLTFLASFATD